MRYTSPASHCTSALAIGLAYPSERSSPRKRSHISCNSVDGYSSVHTRLVARQNPYFTRQRSKTAHLRSSIRSLYTRGSIVCGREERYVAIQCTLVCAILARVLTEYLPFNAVLFGECECECELHINTNQHTPMQL